jgi:hypothetical protein
MLLLSGMKLTTLAGCLMAAGLLGCAGTGEVEYGGGVAVQSPDLVEVQPGVQVLADADAPVFYSDGAYWEYRDGMWFRSGYYDRGFARVDINYVPVRIRTIDNPRAYVHYRRHEGRGYARPAPVERHEVYRQPVPARAQGGVYVTPGYRPGPVIRDHRDDRREERREERHDERHEHHHDHD